MTDDNTTNTTEVPTRRDYMKYGGAVIGGGLLAGCTGESSPSGGTNNSNDSDGGNTPVDDGGNSYSVTLSPVGEVEFESVPENVMAYAINYADTMVAFGHGDAVNAVWGPETIGPTLEFYYGTLDGVSFDWRGLTKLTDVGGSTISKEVLYELDSDVHFIDPCYLGRFKGWNNADLQEVRKNVGPFFGNYYSRKHTQPPKGCRDGYHYYTLWELTAKFAQVFREQRRYEALNQIHEKLDSHIQMSLPPKNDRPTVGMVYPRLSDAKPGFYVHHLTDPGYFWAHTQPLKAVDAFADIEMTSKYGGQLIDYEAMLEVDPDVILLNHAITSFYDVSTVQESIRTHPIGRELTAVKTDRVYASINPRQGPIMNLFNLEMTSKQLYPEQFGEWPGYTDGKPYPDISENEQLFDHQRVAAISKGAF